MKKLSILVAGLFLAISMNLSAKCFNFSEGGGIKVCVPGTGFSSEKKAKEVCEKVKGGKCGNVTGNSGSCSGGKCYDGSGKESRDLKAD